MSFQKWNGLDPDRGIRRASTTTATSSRRDPVFWVAFRNTVIWTHHVPDLPAADRASAGARAEPEDFRTRRRCARYTTCRSSSRSIAVATMWRWMYDPFFGLFSQLMTNMGLAVLDPGLAGRSRRSRSTGSSSRYLWQSVGFSMVLFLAGLQGVSQTLVEAARIDGAGRWSVFRHVTLPALHDRRSPSCWCSRSSTR